MWRVGAEMDLDACGYVVTSTISTRRHIRRDGALSRNENIYRVASCNLLQTTFALYITRPLTTQTKSLHSYTMASATGPYVAVHLVWTVDTQRHNITEATLATKLPLRTKP